MIAPSVKLENAVDALTRLRHTEVTAHGAPINRDAKPCAYYFIAYYLKSG